MRVAPAGSSTKKDAGAAAAAAAAAASSSTVLLGGGNDDGHDDHDVVVATKPPRRWRLASLAVLTLVNTSNFWQRNLLYSLSSVYPPMCDNACEGAAFVPLCETCEEEREDASSCTTCQECRADNDASFYSIRDASCMSDEAYGLLASVVFTAMFSVSGLVAGYLIDTYDSRLLHAGAVLVWSVASFVKVLDSNLTLIVVSRLVMGVAQGFNAPCCYPAIAYNFAHAERATANGVYSTGTYLGSALATLSLAFAMALGWRVTTVVASVSGVVAAVLVYFVVDRPPRHVPSAAGAADRGLCAQLTESVRVITRVPRLAFLYAATSVRMTATVTLWTYLPVYFSRAFATRQGDFSLVYACGTLVCGAASSALGGLIADRWARTRSGAHALVPAIGTLLSIPFIAAVIYAQTFNAAAACLLCTIFFGECWLGPCMVLLYKDSPTSMLATQVSLLLVVNQSVAALGPWFISLQDPGTTAIRQPFFTVVCLTCLVACGAFAALGYIHDRYPQAAAANKPKTHTGGDESESTALLKDPATLDPTTFEATLL